MKKLKILIIPVLIVVPFLILVLFSGYGNTKNHPTLNDFITNAFLKKNNKGNFSMKKFANYTFRLDKKKLKGNAITKTGLFNPGEIDRFDKDLANWAYTDVTFTEEMSEKTPLEWIAHGGFSADVPEVPASFRHFYDPTRSDNENHLTDDVNSKLLNWIQSMFKNPETDGVEWALGKTGSFGTFEHNYTWENGKKFMKGALEEKDTEKRDEFMVKAWRSLGETLHMIADNGCPAHVRNDAHPSIPIRLMSYFGNPDPYEELMDEYQKKNNNALNAFRVRPVSGPLAEKFSKAGTTLEIADELAVFTNQNFFTTETISGKNRQGNEIKPIAHPDYVHNSPKLHSLEYSSHYYRKDIGGHDVLMCTDKWFFGKYPVSTTYPYIDDTCVKSQAMALIPAITEAGVHVMKLFIPDLTVKIISLSEDGTISGEIGHKTDKEYTQNIRYNGPVRIMTNTLVELGKFEAKNGRFSGKISNADDVELNAEIEFGGIIVKSDPKTLNRPVKKVAPAAADHFNLQYTIIVYTSYTDGYNDDKQAFTRSEFKGYESPGQYGFQISKGGYFSGSIKNSWLNCTIEGERNNQKIVWMKVKNHETWRTRDMSDNLTLTREIWTNIELKDIPVEASSGENDYGISYHLEGWDFDNERPAPEFQRSLVKLEQKIIFYPSKKEIEIDHINYSNSEIKTNKQLLAHGSIFRYRPTISVRISFNNN